jgi:CheY-like chemotaxis protein
MNKETLDRMFEPFFTTKFTGRGLGMAAVMGIVKNHHGAIMVETAVEQGASIRVLFPTASLQAEAKAISAKRSQITSSKHSAKTHKGTVLLVEDEADVMSVCKIMLKELGYDVQTANNGEEAVEIFRKNKSVINVVLLDYSMPKMDGLAAFTEMIKIKTDVKVILASGYNKDDISRQFGKHGLAAFIQKPFSISVLRETLESLA